VVRTWGDLARQPAIEADDGITVRLGLSAKHASANYGVLIYCLHFLKKRVVPEWSSEV
jgi:hypothetical protein